MHTSIDPLRENIRSIQKGLFQIGRHHAVALPSHSAWELIDDLEDKVSQLLEQLDHLTSEPEVEDRAP